MTVISEVELKRLQTELRNPNTYEIDKQSATELARTLHRENHGVADSIDPILPMLGQALEVIDARLRSGGRMFYFGAGTSGRLGVLDASECPPTFGVSPDLIQGVIAGGDFALRNSIEGAEDDPVAGAKEVKSRGVGSKDIVIGIAASGRTPWVIGALREARNGGAFTIGVTNVSPSALEAVTDITLAAVTGPEPVTGSTRMKAGTAQKMILNLLSTGAMILQGKTYGNLMVDVRATNEKLKDRALRIVCEATGVDSVTALSLLEESGWRAKTAIVSALASVSSAEADARLEQSGGVISRALEL